MSTFSTSPCRAVAHRHRLIANLGELTQPLIEVPVRCLNRLLEEPYKLVRHARRPARRHGGHTRLRTGAGEVCKAAGTNYDPLVFATQLFQSYLARWGVEPCFDLRKNKTEVETIRARTYAAAQNLFALAWLTLALLCQLHALSEPLCHAVLALYQCLRRSPARCTNRFRQ